MMDNFAQTHRRRQETHPPQVEVTPPSRYKSILIFIYFKVK
jgi:hypothetical protein